MNQNLVREQSDWLQSLEHSTRINTLNYWAVRDLIRYRKIEGLASKFNAFMGARGWNDLGVFSQSIKNRKVVHFQSFEDWISADYSDGGLAIAPLQLLRLLSNSVEFDASIDACISVVNSLDIEIVKSVKESLSDISTGLACMHGDHWAKLDAAVVERIKNPDLELSTTIVGSNVVRPRSGSIQRVLDRIQRVMVDAEQVARRGLSVPALQEAYTLLVQGMATPTQALRVAGLIPSSALRSRSVYLVKDADESARRIVESIGVERAQQLAELILKQSNKT